jgi:hypothetical protein
MLQNNDMFLNYNANTYMHCDRKIKFEGAIVLPLSEKRRFRKLTAGNAGDTIPENDYQQQSDDY